MTKPRRPRPPRAIDIVRAFTERWQRIPCLPFIDWGEPACFACGYFQPRWDEVAPWDESMDGPTPDKVLNERWERSRLQKAHLIGYQFDGPNTPDNYAMLCRRCHIDAPDVPDAEQMVRWIARGEPYSAALAREVIAAAPDELISRWMKAGSPSPDFDSVIDRAGVHFDPFAGAGVALSTLAIAGVEAIESAVSGRPRGQLRLQI